MRKCKKCKDDIYLFTSWNNSGLCNYCFEAMQEVYEDNRIKEEELEEEERYNKVKSRKKYFKDITNPSIFSKDKI